MFTIIDYYTERPITDELFETLRDAQRFERDYHRKAIGAAVHNWLTVIVEIPNID